MYVPIWALGLAAFAFVVLARLAFARRGGEMVERQRRAAPALALSADEEAALLAHPDVAQPLAAGRKIEAIRELRRLSGLGLKEAKELVERHGER